MDIFKNNNFSFNEIDYFVNNKKDFWLICYEPIVGFNCKTNIDENVNFKISQILNFHLINGKKIIF